MPITIAPPPVAFVPSPQFLPQTQTPANNAVPFTRSAPTPNSPPPGTNWSLPKPKGAPLPLVAAPAAASPAAAPILPVLGAGATGIGLGELGRRGLAQQGFEDFDYPSNAPELLRDPLGTLRDGLKGLAESYGDAFGAVDLAGTPPPLPLSNPLDAPPFTGGQSPGVLYRVNYSRWINDPLVLGSSDVRNGFGPISIRVTDAEGRQHAIFGGQDLISGIGTFRPDLPGHGYRIDSIQRVDGQPDTGGDPAPNPTQKAGTPSRTKPSAFVPSPLPAPQPAPETAPRTAPKPTAPPFAPFETPSPGTLSPPVTPGTLSPPKSEPKKLAPPPVSLPAAPSGSEDPDSKGKLKRAPKTAPKTAPDTDPDSDDPSKKDICKSPCIVEILRLLKKIYAAIGVDDFPLRHPLLTGEVVGVQKNLVELVEWSVRNTDAVNGYWPLEVKILGADGKDKVIKVKDQSEALHELFGLLFTIAEDADAAVNIGARGVVETIQTKVSTVQSGQALKAIIKFLGFNTKTTKDKIKISVSPGASGSDNKLQNQEMAAFLKPSEQLYPGIEYQDSKQLLIMLERMLEDVEIARAALYKPLKKSKRGEDNLTGEAIRREKLKSGADIYEEEWNLFLESLKKKDTNPDDKKKK